MVGYVDELEEHAAQLRHSGSDDGSAVDHGTLLANQEACGGGEGSVQRTRTLC